MDKILKQRARKQKGVGRQVVANPKRPETVENFIEGRPAGMFAGNETLEGKDIWM
jgi:hypothetical protein